MVEKIRNKMKEAKGFTLVELIVVLVILAILAALLVPALTGYIDRANEQKIVAQTRQAVMAAQTIASEQYAKEVSVLEEVRVLEKGTQIGATNADTYGKAIAELGEVKADNITSVTADKGVVTSLTYKLGGKTCTYSKTTGDYTVS